MLLNAEIQCRMELTTVIPAAQDVSAHTVDNLTLT